MRTLFVFADFDWLDEPKLVGELGYESLRGSDSYSFKFDNEWLNKFGNLFLSADINNYPGPQYTQPGAPARMHPPANSTCFGSGNSAGSCAFAQETSSAAAKSVFANPPAIYRCRLSSVVTRPG